MKELCVGGMAVMDEIRGKEYLGGAAAFVAVNGKRFGLDTALMTLFGNDAASSMFVRKLEREGIDLSLSATVHGAGLSRNVIDHTDRTKGWKDNGLSKAFQDMRIDYAALSLYRLAHMASPHYDLVKKVVYRGKPVREIFSYSPGPKIIADERYFNKDALCMTDVIFLNEAEWTAMRQLLGINRVHELLAYGLQNVVVTFGKEKVVYAECGSETDYVVPVMQMEDGEATGAGDSFALGFLTGYMRKLPVRTCVVIGMKFSLEALQTTGGMIEEIRLQSLRRELEHTYEIRFTDK